MVKNKILIFLLVTLSTVTYCFGSDFILIKDQLFRKSCIAHIYRIDNPDNCIVIRWTKEQTFFSSRESSYVCFGSYKDQRDFVYKTVLDELTKGEKK